MDRARCRSCLWQYGHVGAAHVVSPPPARPVSGRPTGLQQAHRRHVRTGKDCTDDSHVGRGQGRRSTPQWRTTRRRGAYRSRREAFTDPDIFELEMKYIFEGNWIYLAHETQLPNNNDYLTTYMGRQPIVITRDKTGELHALINACSHRGAMLCRRKKDNRSTFTCPFHGWTFNNTGRLLKVKDPRGADYPEQFNNEGSHDLTKVPRFESYRGFLFGSLNPDVPSSGGASRRRRQDHRHGRRPVSGRARGPEGLVHLHLRRQLEAAGRERRRRLPRQCHPLELRRHDGAAQQRRIGHRDQGDGRGPVGQAARRVLLVGQGPRAAVERVGQPGGPAAVGQAGRIRGAVRRGPGRLDAQVLAESVPVPERLRHGPVRVPDPALPPDLGRPDRGDHLLHRAQG